jgi:hypothetical protein
LPSPAWQIMKWGRVNGTAESAPYVLFIYNEAKRCPHFYK